MKNIRVLFCAAVAVLATAACDTVYGVDCATGQGIAVHASATGTGRYPNCSKEFIAAREAEEKSNLEQAVHTLDKDSPVDRAEVPGSGAPRVDDASEDYMRSESSSVH